MVVSGIMFRYMQSNTLYLVQELTQCVGEGVLKQTCDIWILQTRRHVRDDILCDAMVCMPNRRVLEGRKRTSTAVLLKVRHAGSGLM